VQTAAQPFELLRVTAVRYQGIIHDFVMLNALRETAAADAAIAQASAVLRAALAPSAH
jgi:acetyl esterase